jgi:hypothetical protein
MSRRLQIFYIAYLGKDYDNNKDTIQNLFRDLRRGDSKGRWLELA